MGYVGSWRAPTWSPSKALRRAVLQERPAHPPRSTQPRSPAKLNEFDLRAIDPIAYSGGYGAIAVTREASGDYLFALSDPGKPVAFFRSVSSADDPLGDDDLELEAAGLWDPNDRVSDGGLVPDDLAYHVAAPGLCAADGPYPPDACAYVPPGTIPYCVPDPAYFGWTGVQMINFVRDSDGALYLITGDNTSSTEPFTVGQDWLRLWSVENDGASFRTDVHTAGRLEVSHLGRLRLRLRVTDTYGPNTDVLDDCATLYVPEPGPVTLGASAILALALLHLLRRARERKAARS